MPLTRSYVWLLTALACTIGAHTAWAQGTPQPPAPLQYSIGTYPTVTGTSWAVHAGDDLQATLNGARPGDEVVIDAGATFSGSYILPVQCGTDPNWIVIRTSAISSLPPLGSRVDPSFAG